MNLMSKIARSIDCFCSKRLTFVFIFFLTGLLLKAQVTPISFSPLSAPAGASITITGFGFNPTPGENIVWFGAVRGTVTTATLNSLTVIVPTGATHERISVTVSGLTVYSQSQFLLSIGSSPLTTKSYIQHLNFDAGTQLDNLLALDVDGDGKPDLITAVDSLVIQRNTSTLNSISFQSAPAISKVNHYTIKMAKGDIDGDGKTDLITVRRINILNDSLTVLKNNSTPGNISLTKLDFPCGKSLGNMMVTDIDNDGKPDIVLNGTDAGNTGKTWVYRNTTTGGTISFAAPLTFTFGVSSYNWCATDIDADGKTDLVCTSGPTDKVLLIRNNSTPGTISLAMGLEIIVGGYPTFSYVSDIDGDGKTDIIIRNGNLPNKKISILRNTTTGSSFSFVTTSEFGSTLNPVKLAIADMDGDGKPDIAALNGDVNNTVTIYKNTSSIGNISMAAGVENTSEFNMYDIEICDFDGDGRPDIGLANKTLDILKNVVKDPIIFSVSPLNAKAANTVTIKGYSFTGTTSVSFSGIAAGSFNVVSDTIVTAVLAADLSGNVAVTNAWGTGVLNDAYPVPQVTAIVPDHGLAGSAVTIQGRYFNVMKDDNTVYFGSVKTTVNTATDSTLEVLVPKGAIYDRLSVTTHRMTAFSTQRFNLTFSGGDTSFTAASFDQNVTFPTQGNPSSVVINDVDGDGKPDLAVSDFNNSSYYSTILKNKSDSAKLSFESVVDNSSQYQYKFPLADLDGDGRYDKVIAIAGPPSVTIGVYRNASSVGNILFGRGVSMHNTSPYMGSFFSGRVSVDDMDRDGKPDIISGNNEDGRDSGSVFILKNASYGNVLSWLPLMGFSTGTTVHHMITADIDGDSLPDVVTYDYSPGRITVLKNTNSTAGLSLAPHKDFLTGTSLGGLAVADLDGDGKKDILAINLNTTTFSTYRNTSAPGDISFASKLDFPRGNETYGVNAAIGDLNGDNKPDIVITNYNDSSVTVYRNTSSPGIILLAKGTKYRVGAFPISATIGDVDMDGVVDLVVANEGSSSVSILRNLQGDPREIKLCNPVGNATLNAGMNGSLYQWQLSTDTVHFNNIIDDANYNGSVTATLALTAIPSSWYGYRYRCIIDGNVGRISTLKFVNTWTGSTNNDWNTASNWSCGAVPDMNTDVKINDGEPVLNMDATVRSLFLSPTAHLTINTGFHLTVTH
jgi:hypothetical protein